MIVLWIAKKLGVNPWIVTAGMLLLAAVLWFNKP